mmetsp:Transcript_19282/g.56237  ORF Transcript_19282/g.56237 Transcript_19282/m.56237 type:complete len:284 (-) Transcript_19282:1704-2555(-)
MGSRGRTLRTITSLIAALIVVTAINNIFGSYRSLIPRDEDSVLGLERPKTVQKPRKMEHENRKARAPSELPGIKGSVVSRQNILLLPNVLLIGVQKGGSSAVSSWLFEHGVCRPRTFPGEPQYWSKEVHLFDREERRTRGPKFYSRRFSHCYSNKTSTDVIAMDATPNYLPYARKVRRMYEDAGGRQADGLKIIVILREPVSRELSLYNHKANEFRKESDNFEFWRGVVDFDKSERTNKLELLSFSKFVERKVLPSVNTTDGSCTFKGHVNLCLSLYAHFLAQ